MTPCIESKKKIILLLSSASWIYPKLATDTARVRTRANTVGALVPGTSRVFDLCKKIKITSSCAWPTSLSSIRVPTKTTKSKKNKKNKKPYNTWDSHVVPYRSTDQAQRCLTSQFGWDAVLSPWYDRMTTTCFSATTRVRIRLLGKKRISHFYFIFYFSRGLEHCGPFIRRHIKHQTKSEGSGLPKFDSKILISEQASNIRPSRRSLCRIVTGGGQKSDGQCGKNKNISFAFFFFFQWKCRRHPQRLAVLQDQGHVRPGSGASTAGPQPWLKQFT